MLQPHEIRKLGLDLPGYSFLTAYEAALPSYECSLEVRVLGKQDLSALEQAVLAAVAHGVSSVAAIDLLYGIGRELVEETVSGLQSFDLVEPYRGSSIFIPTDQGTKAYENASFLRPEIATLRVYFDALTGTVSSVNRDLYIGVGESVKRGLYSIPSRFDEPRVGDIPREDVAKLFRRSKMSEKQSIATGELLDIIGLTRVIPQLLPCEIAAFDASDHSHFAFRVLERGQRLPEHEARLQAMVEASPEVLPIHRVEDETLESEEPAFVRPEILQDLADKEQELDDLARILEDASESQNADPLSPESVLSPAVLPSGGKTREELNAVRKRLEELERERRETGTRRIQNSEHRLFLLQAFKEAKKRIIIISPWLAPTAMNQELMDLMRKALLRGVDVFIGWGMPDRGDDDREARKASDIKRLLFQLNKLQAEMTERLASAEKVILGDKTKRRQQKVGNLRVVKLGNTHEKILIVDEARSIMTSFNWLSFRGDPNRAVRNEAGYMVTSPSIVREDANHIMARIEAAERDQQSTPAPYP